MLIAQNYQMLSFWFGRTPSLSSPILHPMSYIPPKKIINKTTRICMATLIMVNDQNKSLSVGDIDRQIHHLTNK